MNPEAYETWLKAAAAPLTALGALVGAVLGGIKFLRPALLSLNFFSPELATIIAIGVPVGTALVLLTLTYQYAMTRKSRLVRPDRFDLRVKRSEDLLARGADSKNLLELILNADLLNLDGESGSGKSSLVQFGLMPLVRDETNFLPIMVTRYGRDWTLGPAQQLHDAIWSTLSEPERARLRPLEPIALGSATADTIAVLLEAVAQHLGRPTLLIFDQFDDYQLVHRQRFLTGLGSWLSPSALRSANPFWEAIAAATIAGKSKLIFVVRSDAASGLHSIQFVDTTQSRPVQRISARSFPAFVAQILANDGEGEIIKDPGAGWETLVQLLDQDMTRQGELLPQQIRITFLGLRELPALTPAEYRRAGRAAGVEALYMRRSIETASERSKLTQDQVRHMLVALVEHTTAGGIKTRSRLEADLAAVVADDAARQSALTALADAEIVRKSVDEREGFRWRLDHDYLAAAVLAEDRANNRHSALLRDAAEAWGNSSGWLRRYAALLPVRTQIALLWARLRSHGRFIYRPYGTYAAISVLRAAPLALLLATTAGWGLWVNSSTYQVDRLIDVARTTKVSLGDDGPPAWANALALSGHVDEALARARASAEGGTRAKMLAGIATQLVNRGDVAQATNVLIEAMAAGSKAPENVRMESYQEIINACQELIGKGRGDLAKPLLRKIAANYLPTIPLGNNRNYVAFGLAKALRLSSAPEEAHQLLAKMLPDIEADKNSILTAALEFLLLGDDTTANLLLSRYSQPDVAKSRDPDEDVVRLGYAACVQGEIGDKAAEKKTFDQAIESARSLEGKSFSEEDRHYVKYFTFWNASSFARMLVKFDRKDLIPFFILREGNGEDRVNAYVAAAVQAYKSHDFQSADQFMAAAANQAKREAIPKERAAWQVLVGRGYAAVGKTDLSQSTLELALRSADAIDESYQSENRIDGTEKKLAVLIDIAVQLREIQAGARAHQVLEEALAVSNRTVEDPSYYLPRLAGALAQDGQLKRARLVAERVRDGNEQFSALAEALRGYALYLDPKLRKADMAGSTDSGPCSFSR